MERLKSPTYPYTQKEVHGISRKGRIGFLRNGLVARKRAITILDLGLEGINTLLEKGGTSKGEVAATRRGFIEERRDLSLLQGNARRELRRLDRS